MKIAIVQDELVRKGGAEQVVLSFKTAFPDAPIYTLSYNHDKTYPEFKDSVIKTSWLGKFIKDDKNLKRLFFPLGIMAMKQLNVKGYDVILQSTTHCSKYIQIDPDAIVITYCHTPFRLVWRPESYEEVAQASTLKKSLYKAIIRILKNIDRKSAERTDWFLTNSTEVVGRIKNAYNPTQNITVINPAVKCNNFYISKTIKDYYLVVSRFEPYKKVDLAIQAFNKMPHKKLLIVGKGSMEAALKAMANKNITFLDGLNAKGLAKTYAECQALIFPQHEDYGITPLEANASGRPVIAFAKGGVLDTMIPYTNDETKATAVFFEKQHVDSLIDAINKFEVLSFDSTFIRAHAEKFDESIFVKKIQQFVEQKWQLKTGANSLNKEMDLA